MQSMYIETAHSINLPLPETIIPFQDHCAQKKTSPSLSNLNRKKCLSSFHSSPLLPPRLARPAKQLPQRGGPKGQRKSYSIFSSRRSKDPPPLFFIAGPTPIRI